jgi:outer membrane immunogenic protein
MTKFARRLAGFTLMVACARTASAQSPNPWDGFYVGVNAGEARSQSCNTWRPAGTAIDAAIASALTSQVCPNGGDLIGGVQFGENFQYKRFVWGIGADIDLWKSKDQSQVVKYTGGVPPSGTYALSGKLGPSAFGVIGPRIGYAGDTWLPYVRAGAIVTGGSHSSTLSYTAPSATTSTASFNGGRNFSSAGWVAGGGTEIGLNGAWSITLEFLHANLGKGADSTANCAGSMAACSAFTGLSFDSVHDSVTANIFRVGFTYWFSYWNL